MKEKYIFTVTSISNSRKATRCFGFFFTRAAAIKAVKANYCDLQECLYEYIIIEKQGRGIHAHAHPIKWFKWIGNSSLHDTPGFWQECETPTGEYFTEIINWNCLG